MNAQQSTILVMLCIIMVCSAHIGGEQVYQHVSPQVYCGRTLARALAVFCFDYTNSENKRSESGTMYNAILSPYYKEKEQDGQQFGWPWMAPHNARGLSLPSRGKRFVVNECCEKACSVDEMLSYC